MVGYLHVAHLSSISAQPTIEYLFDEADAIAVNTGSLGSAFNGVINGSLRSPENHPLAPGKPERTEL